MKIIKHRKQDLKPLRQFTCEKCGCVFQCEEDEYWKKPQYEVGVNNTSYTTKRTYITCCPECHKVIEVNECDNNITCTYAGTGDYDGDNTLKNFMNTAWNGK